jgi:hypothetical protein
MRPKNLLPFIILFFMSSCDKGDEELKCSQYFLAEESDPGDYSQKFFYNGDGLMSAMVFQAGTLNNRLDIYYDQDKRIREVKSIQNGQRTEFFHDVSGRLVSTMRYEGGSRIDSLAIEYDGSGRIIKRSTYRDPPSITFLHSYYTVEYPANATMKVDFYDRVPFTMDTFEYAGTFSYTMDGKKRPYPDEYYSIYLSWTNVVLASNVTAFESLDKTRTVTSNNTIEYLYNSGGYPLKEKGSTKSYRYTCEPSME